MSKLDIKCPKKKGMYGVASVWESLTIVKSDRDNTKYIPEVILGSRTPVVPLVTCSASSQAICPFSTATDFDHFLTENIEICVYMYPK